MEKKREKISRYNLITGEDTFASQTAQNPATSRRLLSLIPSIAGDLTRELPEPLYVPTQLPAGVMQLYEFDRNDLSGNTVRFYFAATATQLFQNVSSAWSVVSAVGTLAGTPMFATINNQLHMCDGTNNWLFDGTTWVREGFRIPLSAPQSVTDFGGGTPTNILHPAVLANGWGASVRPGYFDGVFASSSNVAQAYSDMTAFATSSVGAAQAISGNDGPFFTFYEKQHEHNYGGVVWSGGGWTGTATANQFLAVDSQVPGSYTTMPQNSLVLTQNSGVCGVFYSLDGGVTWTPLYTFSTGSADSRGRQWDQIQLTPGQNLANIQLMAFTTSASDLVQLIYDVRITNKSMVATQGNGGNFVQTTRFYWYNYADQTSTRPHEGTTSPMSAGSGTIASQDASQVFANQGTITLSGTTITGVGTQFTKSAVVGDSLYATSGGIPVLVGTVTLITSDTVMTISLNGLPAVSASHYMTAPPRATHWHLYASEAESSQVGQLLAEIALPAYSYIDTSPWASQPGTLFTSISRPVRNDPSAGSSLMAVHKRRMFRRQDNEPNFFFFSAAEEVSSLANGNASECFPGVDVNTQSDIVNEDSYPDSSNHIRALTSHGDALYIATEKQCIPLYGETIDDFGLSQVTAFAVGTAGRFASISTPHGLVFVSYDRKVYLYPTANYPWAYVPKDVNITDSLIEIGKPQRKKFETIKSSDLDDVRLAFYQYGRRNWLLMSFQDNTSAYQTWVYDFDTKGWTQLQRGFTSLAVFEVSPGNKVAIGGGPDGFTYVIDDLTGTYSTAGSLPASLWRPALIDFGDPDSHHVLRYIEYELSNPLMANDITVNFYLDPQNADSPGTPRTVVMQQVFGANLWRGFFAADGQGTTCQRVLIEFSVASSTNPGAFRGVKMKADPATGLIPSASVAIIQTPNNWQPNSQAPSLTLQTNEVNNASQTLLDLHAGAGVTLTDNGAGRVTIAATSGLLLETNGTPNGSQLKLNLVAGGGIGLVDDGTGDVTVSNTQTAGANFANNGVIHGGQELGGVLANGGTRNLWTANQVMVCQLIVPYQITLRRALAVSSASYPSATFAYGIYNLAGNSLLVSGVFTGSAFSNVSKSVNLSSTITLQPGVYWFACASDQGTFFVGPTISFSASVAGTVLNADVTRIGYAANAMVSGVLPATLGTITATTDDLPSCFFVG